MVSASLRVQDDVQLKVRSTIQESGPRMSLRRAEDPRDQSALVARLEHARSGLSFRELSEMTGTNQESVRRYHRFGQPSLEYVLRFCLALEISPNWLLLGKGVAPMSDPLNRLLVDATAPELLHALGNVFQSKS